MVGVGILLSRCEVFSLYGPDMEQDRLLQVPGVAEDLRQLPQVVAVHRPQIGEAHILKQAAGEQALLHRFLQPVGHPVDLPPEPGGVHHLPVVLLEGEILGLQALAGQVLRHAAHVLGDGHAVVVEDDQQLAPALPRGGQALIGQSAGERSVSDESQHPVVLPQHVPGPGHPHRHRHRVGGVSGDECVMDALRWLGEAGDPAELPDGGHLLPPACEHLVWVALMAHVKDQPVPAGVEHPVDGHGELHYPQVGGQMPSGPGYVPDQLLPELAAQLPGLLVPHPRQDGAI